MAIIAQKHQPYICALRQGELPTADELAPFDAILFTGGAGDAFSDEPWVVQARELVRSAHARKQRMLGVCFGHQLIAQALGGRVDRAPAWGSGATTITFDEEAREVLPNMQLPPTAAIHVSHRDQVHELPEGAKVLASAEQCPIAMFSIGDQVLCIQGHPEFNERTVRSIVDAKLQRNMMTAQEAEVSNKSYQQLGDQCQQDYALLQGICAQHLRK
mmetsp:Transcript_8372/g.25117  ORF Transcript_8372/g.25117 Transcript_8372/m.25117 type:complete len:216 (-) Transcript_8372:4082-4729(-)